MKGFFIKVPESENDNVYETVVQKVLEESVLWTFQDMAWLGEGPDKPPEITVTVVTNRDDARFILSDEKGTPLGPSLTVDGTWKYM
jgi:hypothetical protein